MIRVLHSVSNMDRGGIETMLMNYYRHIDREKVQFDFIVNKQKPGDYDDEIRRLGGHIYQSPGLNPLHYPAYLRFVQQTVAADPRIRILHAHNEAMGLYALKGAGDRSFPTPSSRRPSASPPPSAPKCGRATGWRTGWCWVM